MVLKCAVNLSSEFIKNEAEEAARFWPKKQETKGKKIRFS